MYIHFCMLKIKHSVKLVTKAGYIIHREEINRGHCFEWKHELIVFAKNVLNIP